MVGAAVLVVVVGEEAMGSRGQRRPDKLRAAGDETQEPKSGTVIADIFVL